MQRIGYVTHKPQSLRRFTVGLLVSLVVVAAGLAVWLALNPRAQPASVTSSATDSKFLEHDHSLHGPLYIIKQQVPEHDHSLHGPIYTVKNRVSNHDHSLHGPIYPVKEQVSEHDHSVHGPIYSPES